MSGKSATISLIVLLLLLCVVPISIRHVSADMADMYSLEVGGTMANCSSLTMPEVDTHIRIVRDPGFTITVSSNFYILSNQTMNASFAFVYPKAWRSFLGTPQPEFSVHANNSRVSYTIETYENLTANGFIVENSDFGGDWITRAEFVLFSLNMTANRTYLINVRTTAIPITDNYGGFSYIIGSAKTFAGETHQIIEMQVIREESFVSFGFSPEYYLTESSNATGTIALWDLIINDSLNFSTVHFSFVENEYHGIQPQPDPEPFIWTLIAYGVILALLVILCRRYMKVRS